MKQWENDIPQIGISYFCVDRTVSKTPTRVLASAGIACLDIFGLTSELQSHSVLFQTSTVNEL